MTSAGGKNEHPLLVRWSGSSRQASSATDSFRSCKLSVTATIGVESGYSYTATNVIAEIPGEFSSRGDRIVWLTSRLARSRYSARSINGVNVVMLINIARQISRLGLQPERTIRLVLWNGEEQMMVGSYQYTEQHEDELDNHIVATSFDIGSGKTTGFFTGGRPDLIPLVDRYLVAGCRPRPVSAGRCAHRWNGRITTS